MIKILLSNPLARKHCSQGSYKLLFHFTYRVHNKRCFKGKELQTHLKQKHLEFCGEPDEFRKGKIDIAHLQICSELPIDDQVKNRKDMAKVFRKASEENIPYEKLFETVKRRAQDIPVKGSTDEAINKFLQKHGNMAVISGSPGIGKTTLTKRILYEMWTGSLSNPEIIFFIRFRELNYKQNTDLLKFLVPLLPENFQNEDNRKIIFKRIEKCDNVYIIMDGFDEADINRGRTDIPCSINCTNTAEGFIYNLLARNIFPHSKKLITSRPYQIAKLQKHFQPDILLSIQGLDKKGFGQICSNICRGNKARCEKILKYLKAHPDIKSYCRTPVICIMVMESLNKMYEVEENSVKETKEVFSIQTYNASYTLTGIFASALKEWLLKKLSLSTFSLKKISAFALSKFDQNRFYFTELDLREEGIEEHYITTFLTTILKGTRKKEMYFIHLMWQEFLAAVKLRLYTTDYENKELQSDILSKLSSKKYKMVATKFLFGLCNEDTLNLLLEDLEIEDGLSNRNNRINCRKTLLNFSIKTLETLARNWSKNWNAGELVAALGTDAYNVDETNAIAAADTVNAGVVAEDESNDNDSRQNMIGEEDENESTSGSSSDGDDGDDVSDNEDDEKSYFSSILPILGWVYEVRDDDFTSRAASYLLSEIDIENEQILPSDIPIINHALRARTTALALKLRHLRFVGNCSKYFIEQLQETLTVNNRRIRVSYINTMPTGTIVLH